MAAATNSNGDSLPIGPTICVFCGASPGTNESHMKAARSLAAVLASKNATLIYGGGNTGLMGEVARTLISLSPRGAKSVHGIIPRALLAFERHDGDDEKVSDESEVGITTVVLDMHARKSLMAKQVMDGPPGSGFVALAGGYGTFEELMEMATWNQLGIHDKGIVVYNVDGYWDSLFRWVDNAVASGFVSESNRRIMLSADNAEAVVEALATYQNTKGRFQLQWDEK